MGKKPKGQDEYHVNPDVQAQPDVASKQDTVNQIDSQLKELRAEYAARRNTGPIHSTIIGSAYQDQLSNYIRANSPTQAMFGQEYSEAAVARHKADAAWLSAFGLTPPGHYKNAINAAKEDPDRNMVDNGTAYVLMDADTLDGILKLLKVFEKHGAPQTQRNELTWAKYRETVEEVLRAYQGGQGDQMPAEYRMLSNRAIDRVINEVVAMTLSRLNMLPSSRPEPVQRVEYDPPKWFDDKYGARP